MSIPLDHDKLVALLENASSARYNEIRAALLAEHPGDPDKVDRLFEGACSEAMHLANLAAARANLAENLRQVALLASYVSSHLNELMAPSQEDSEYAGSDGVHLKAVVHELRRNAYLANVLNRHIRRFDDPDYALSGVQ